MGLAAQRGPGAGRHAVVVDGPGLHIPGDGAGIQAAAVVGIIEAAGENHVDADVAGLGLRWVGGEGADPVTAIGRTQQLLAGDFRRRDHIGLEQGHGPGWPDDLRFHLLERPDGGVLDAHLFEVVLALADDVKLVEILVAPRELLIGLSGQVRIDQVPPVEHRDRLAEPRLVALGDE